MSTAGVSSNSNASPSFLSTRASSSFPDECPICFEILLPPVYQCQRGHLLCENCETRLKNCPQCRIPLSTDSKIRNLFAEHTIQNRSFTCNGCFVVVTPEDVRDHREDCLMRKHNYCGLLNFNCAHECGSTELIDHLRSVHWVTGWNLENAEEGSGFLFQLEQIAALNKLHAASNANANANEGTIRFAPHYIQCMNKLFVVTTHLERESTNGGNSLYWIVSVVGSEKMTEDVMVKIKLAPREASLYSLEWQGPVFSIKSNQKGNGFHVPVNVLEQFGKSVRQNNSNSNQPPAIENSTILEWNIQINLLKRPSSEDSSVTESQSQLNTRHVPLPPTLLTPTLATGYISANTFVSNADVALEPGVWEAMNSPLF